MKVEMEGKEFVLTCEIRKTWLNNGWKVVLTATNEEDEFTGAGKSLDRAFEDLMDRMMRDL